MQILLNPQQKGECDFRIKYIRHLFHQEVVRVRNVKPDDIKFISDVMSISIKGEKFMFPDFLLFSSYRFYNKAQEVLKELCNK
ncbi:MAG: hypothetical protein GXO48_03760 [Chlorobi bacterium]|nr:hypothetical protein [Chlorobiota bacterium]